MGLINRLAVNPYWKFLAKYYYPFVTRHGAADVTSLNWG